MYAIVKVCQVSFVYAIVTNHVNWHREHLRSDRENTGNLKMKFEWVPCLALQYNVLESLDLQFFLFVWVHDIRVAICYQPCPDECVESEEYRSFSALSE